VELNLTLDQGVLDINLPRKVKPRITLKGDFKLDDKTGFHDADSIFIKEDFKVNIIMRRGELILR